MALLINVNLDARDLQAVRTYGGSPLIHAGFAGMMSVIRVAIYGVICGLL
jgi:hypothetical protein